MSSLSRRRRVRIGCQRLPSMSSSIVIVAGLGIALGAACAAALTRRSRERMRIELKAISADVLAQTGESLAQRLTETGRAERERASGEMARRAEEIKGVVRPVQEKLGTMQ